LDILSARICCPSDGACSANHITIFDKKTDYFGGQTWKTKIEPVPEDPSCLSKKVLSWTSHSLEGHSEIVLELSTEYNHVVEAQSSRKAGDQSYLDYRMVATFNRIGSRHSYTGSTPVVIVCPPHYFYSYDVHTCISVHTDWIYYVLLSMTLLAAGTSSVVCVTKCVTFKKRTRKIKQRRKKEQSRSIYKGEDFFVIDV